MTFVPLDRPVQFLKGVGSRRSDALRAMGICTAADLLYHVPRRYDDASTVTPIASLDVGMDATSIGRIRSKGVIPTRSGLRIFQAVLQDDSGMITCAWPGRPWLDRQLRDGDLLLVTGPVRFFHGRQLHPREHTVLSRTGREDDETQADEDETGGTIFVVYPASEEVAQWVLRRVFAKNLDRLLQEAESEEYLSDPDREALKLPSVAEALETLHRPRDFGGIEAARRRLAYDELFFLQLAHGIVRKRRMEQEPGIAHVRTNELIRPLHAALPFQLTAAQSRALQEVFADMTAPARMNRLLQGDVGSGKTMVALFAMALAVEGGTQAALMAPTELLAEQHFATLSAHLTGLGIEPVLLTGRIGSAAKRQAIAGLRDGSVQCVIGTQALIQEGVEFRKLGLVVVDEQHRFGVRQRMALGDASEGSEGPDVLIMSATPIPRSTAMALYGDLDLSIIDELPPGRSPVLTVHREPSEREKVYELLHTQLAAGRQAYIVYPLVEDSDRVELRSATAEFERLRDEVFPSATVGLLHGQLKADEKDRVMRAFRDGEIDLLVATTVIEVGIDVPNATVMVVEHAERFGLSQLHQLRGRVGRGEHQSHCILVSDPGEGALERLRVLERNSDGFEVARHDLRMRGEGDLFGDRQHGREILLRFADLALDEDLLIEAQGRARGVVDPDPTLSAPGLERLKSLLDRRWGERFELFRVG